LRRLKSGLYDYGFATEPVEQTGAARNGQPTHEPLGWLAGNEQRHWGRDPETEAVETVHPLAGGALAQPPAKAEDDVARAVLARQQVSHPPGCENSQEKPEDHVYVSSPLLLPRRRRFVAADAERFLVVLGAPVKQAGSESGPGDQRHDIGAVSPTAGVFDDCP